MNYKLRVYCTLLLFVIIVSVLTSTCHTGYTESSQQPAAAGEMRLEVLDSPANFGSTETDSNGATSYHTVTYEVNVVPNAQGKSLFSSVGTPCDNQTYKVKMQKAKLEIAASDAPFGNFPMWVYVTVAVVIIGFGIWFLGIVITTIRSIRMGEIFISQVAKNIEKIGLILCAIYLVELIASYAITQYLINHIQLAYYAVVFKNECNIMILIMGLSLAVISQIIIMGKDLKEE
ncbi:MAG: DUF2975 domain-containing protein, partial [Bacteroidales bacterium]|nr:DUF2975 domain-containing protein [Bacteroidales bacterium]